MSGLVTLSDKITDDQLAEIERAAVQKYPFALIEQGYLDIKTKSGDLVSLRLNPSQQIIYKKILELRKAKKPVRIIILKCRQSGVSTESEAVLYCLSSQQPNRNSLIMADEEDKANYLHEMSKLFQERLEKTQPHLAPTIKKSNEKKLEWEQLHSQIFIEPSRNVAATRAYTYQYAHLSEAAYFRDLAGVLEGLQGVPDYWDTIILIESTANMYGDEFHKLWTKASSGQTEWTPIFLPWFFMSEYSLPLAGEELYPTEGITFDTENGLVDFLKEEKILQAEHRLTLEQLNWRRWAIINRCNGKVKIFRREFPSNPDEAFLFAGGCVFDVQKLKKQKEKNIKPLAIGNLVELDGKVVFRADLQGKFRIYERISPTTQVAIGADAAEGIEQDASCACGINKRTLNTIMTYHSHTTDTDKFAIEMMKMGRYLNDAQVGIESYPSAHGYAVVHDLYKIYGNVFKMVVEHRVTKQQTEKLGWYATERNVQEARAQFVEEIREDATELCCPILIDECLSYIQDPKTGDIGAAKGKHDDMVRARMIAGKLRKLSPAAPLPGTDYGLNSGKKRKRRPYPNE